MLKIEIVERVWLLVIARPGKTMEVISEVGWKIIYLILKAGYGKKAVDIGEAHLDHVEVCGLPCFHCPPPTQALLPGILQSEDLNTKNPGWRATEAWGWNASISQQSLLTDFQLAIDLTNLLFFSATVFCLVHKIIMGDFVLGLVCIWPEQNALSARQTDGKKTRANSYY